MKNKLERRKERKRRNIQKELDWKENMKDFKIFEPNHNGGEYSESDSIEIGKKLCSRLLYSKNQILSNPSEFLDPGKIWNQMSPQEQHTYINDRFIMKFRLWKIKIRDFILHYNSNIPKSQEYEYLKNALETYWDSPDTLIDNC